MLTNLCIVVLLTNEHAIIDFHSSYRKHFMCMHGTMTSNVQSYPSLYLGSSETECRLSIFVVDRTLERRARDISMAIIFIEAENLTRGIYFCSLLGILALL